MIHEYALDPEAICQWKTFRHVALGFGFDKGRVFARYPQDWHLRADERVTHLLRQNLNDEKNMTLQEQAKRQHDKKDMTTWFLDTVPKVMVNSRKGRSYSSAKTWFENALMEHSNKPFHGIISNREDSEDPPTLNINDIDESKQRWNVARQKFIRRHPDEIGPIVGMLLVYANEIRVVDPYFTADSVEVNMLLACVKCFADMQTTSVDVFQLHVDGEKIKKGSPVEHLRKALAKDWPRCLPPVSIVRWKAKSRHARCILADCGGFLLTDSLRENSLRPDQITLLEKATWRHWWDQYDIKAQESFLADSY